MLHIETERLLIRDFVLEDWGQVHLYASDEEVVQYMIWGPNSAQETRAFIRRALEMQQQEPRWDFEAAVILKKDGTLIGGCGIHKEGPHQGEVGYCFRRDFWRMGYATEAAKAVVGFGFDRLGLHRIYATCRPDNRGSAGVMEKVGMTKEGHLRDHMWYKGTWADSYLYAILEDDWRKQAGSGGTV